jgi:hypothetical protein
MLLGSRNLTIHAEQGRRDGDLVGMRILFEYVVGNGARFCLEPVFGRLPQGGHLIADVSA